MSSLTNIKTYIEFVSILFCSIVFGTGLGFLQGIFAITGQKTELTLEFGAWSAFVGIGVSCVVIPCLYYRFIRNILVVSEVIEIISLISFIGILSAYILGRFFDAGWLSMFITILISIIVTIIYSKA